MDYFSLLYFFLTRINFNGHGYYGWQGSVFSAVHVGSSVVGPYRHERAMGKECSPIEDLASSRHRVRHWQFLDTRNCAGGDVYPAFTCIAGHITGVRPRKIPLGEVSLKSKCKQNTFDQAQGYRHVIG
jgi:hypothetical protein